MEPMEVNVSGNIKHESATPLKVEVTRGQKGAYGWTLSIAGSDMDGILAKTKEADTKLRDMFPQPEGS